MSKRLVAWACQEEDENTGGVIFARTRMAAERIASQTYGCGDWKDGECTAKRAAWADGFQKGLPIRVMVEHGWHFECCECGARINEDYLADAGLPLSGVVGEQDSLCFCGSVCEAAYGTAKRAKDAARAAGLQMMRDELKRRLPAAVPLDKCHAYAEWHQPTKTAIFTEGTIYFDFPGRKISPASFELRRPQYLKMGPHRPEMWCCTGDKAAFAAFIGKKVEDFD